MKNRWLLAPCLVVSLGFMPAAFAQEKKPEGKMEGEHMMEQKGDAMKGTKKETDSMKKESMKDKEAMKDQGDKMGKQ
jgi:pentapeptide MXKDX repeat protein